MAEIHLEMSPKDGKDFLVPLAFWSGKTNMPCKIAGLRDTNEGEIAIDGKVVNGLEPNDHDVAIDFTDKSNGKRVGD